MGAYSVKQWIKCLKDSKRDMTDLPCSSWPRTATTKCNEQKVDTIIIENQKVKVKKIIAQPGAGHNVMQEISEYQKVCCHRVSHLLTDKHDGVWMDVLSQLLQ
jgi:hypothetical protein